LDLWLYNLALAARTRAWATEQRRVTYGETSTMLTAWKKPEDLAFLPEVSSVPLQQCLRHLQSAFTGFFDKRSRYPRFKSRKKSTASAEYTRSAFRWHDGQLTLARRKVAQVHARINDRRRDFLHKLTTRLVRDNQTIVIEDLNVRGMLKNRRLARAIADASWTQLRQMLEYKAAWYGREVITIDPWFPSSKTCSSCGLLLDTLALGMCTWTCVCGAIHDRDVNAARNILAAGLAVTACGDGIRPTRR
jgi:putative transposase